MEDYKKVIPSKLKFKSSALPIKGKKSKKKTSKSLVEAIQIQPEESKEYLPVKESEDTRTEAEKRFDERMKQKEKEFIEKRSKMSYQDVVNEMNQKLEKLTDHMDIPRIAAAGLG